LSTPATLKARCYVSVPTSPPNRKARSSTSSMRIAMSSRGNPRICRAFRGKSLSTP
jgi:hypothetical protein